MHRAFGFPVDFEARTFYKVEFDFLEGIDISWEVMFSDNKDKVKDLIIKPKSTWSYSAYGHDTGDMDLWANDFDEFLFIQLGSSVVDWRDNENNYRKYE